MPLRRFARRLKCCIGVCCSHSHRDLVMNGQVKRMEILLRARRGISESGHESIVTNCKVRNSDFGKIQ